MSIAQLVQFNSIKHKRKQEPKQQHHHHSDHETPLPLYISLMLHAETRKRGIIDKLAKLGICASYSRIQQLSATVTEVLCEQYSKDNVVCPPGLQCGVFTTAAIDNIDHNPSSSTAVEAFHGTGISLIQHPNHEMSLKSHLDLLSYERLQNFHCVLPESYTDIPPMSCQRAEVPLPMTNTSTEVGQRDTVEESAAWLNTVASAMTQENPEKNLLSWSAYYARLQNSLKPICSVALLPLINEYIQSPSMVRHTFDIIKSACSKLNPNQPIVVTGDQPVYAVAKQVQWLLPNLYGEDRIILMMGGLHIEMAMLHVIGD